MRTIAITLRQAFRPERLALIYGTLLAASCLAVAIALAL